jgi:hypothetical protein
VDELKHPAEPQAEAEQVDRGDHDGGELVPRAAGQNVLEQPRRRPLQPEPVLDAMRQP